VSHPVWKMSEIAALSVTFPYLSGAVSH